MVGLKSHAQTLESSLKSLSILERKSGFTGEWKTELGFESSEEDKDDSKAVAAAYRVLPNYKFNNYLNISGDFRITASDGRSQSRFSEFDRNSFEAREAIVELYPLSFLTFSGGILNQSEINNRILVSRWASFPGLKEKLFHKNGAWSLALTAQQTIPSSQSDNTERNEKEALPSFYTETLSLDYNTFPVRFRSGLSHFAYSNLPAVVADKSRLNGNRGSGEGATAKFEYEFSGFALFGRLDGRVSKNFGASLMTELAENQNAPNSASRGQIIEAHLSIGAGPAVLVPKYFTFFRESDVAPSYYTSWSMGGTNRVGQGYGLEVIFEKLNFKVSFENTQLEPVNVSKTQFERNRFLVKLETLYVSF